MGDLLLIDDDPGQLAAQVRRAFPPPGHRIEVARTGAQGVARVRTAPPEMVLLNLRLPDRCGLEVYQQIRGFDGRTPVSFVTGSREAQAVIEAVKQGAYDCLFKPTEPSHLAQVVGEALAVARRLREPPPATEAAADGGTGGQLVGTCPAMRQVYKGIGLVAAQDFPVIIIGESGTGKELVARAIHRHTNRAGQPFLAFYRIVLDGDSVHGLAGAARCPRRGPCEPDCVVRAARLRYFLVDADWLGHARPARSARSRSPLPLRRRMAWSGSKKYCIPPGLMRRAAKTGRLAVQTGASTSSCRPRAARSTQP
jgi:ActR/RegA family two-component response regulator